MLIVYYTEHCSNCDRLTRMLDSMSIEYEKKHANKIPNSLKKLNMLGSPWTFNDDKPLFHGVPEMGNLKEILKKENVLSNEMLMPF